MGQGSMTSLPLILADEMDADWTKVKIDWAPADPTRYGYTFNNARAMAIVGSRAVMLYYNDLRVAGAQVRKVLVSNAAEKWGVNPASLRTEPGFVVDGSGRKLSYGEIASFARVPSPLPAVEKTDLKDKKDFRYIGKSMPRRDTPLKVNGTAKYAIDIDLPGMVYATARHSPVHGGAPESWNDAKVKAIGALGTSGDTAALAVLQALADGEVQTAGVLVLRVKDGVATDLVTGRKIERFTPLALYARAVEISGDIQQESRSVCGMPGAKRLVEPIGEEGLKVVVVPPGGLDVALQVAQRLAERAAGGFRQLERTTLAAIRFGEARLLLGLLGRRRLGRGRHFLPASAFGRNGFGPLGRVAA
jgi:hypothetical protein